MLLGCRFAETGFPKFSPLASKLRLPIGTAQVLWDSVGWEGYSVRYF